jgi:putative ABC transport system permease protein
VLLAALVVAVTALTGVGFFTDRIGQAVDQRAAEVLAADLRLRGTDPVSTDYDALAAARGIATARTISFPSVVFFGGDSALTAIRAVGPGYPLRGKLKVSEAPFAPARETDELPAHGETWLDSRLLARLGAGVGDRVNIGAAAFTVTRVLDYRPGPGLGLHGPRADAPDPDRGPAGHGAPRARQPRDVLTALRGQARRYPRTPAELHERMTKSERLVGVAEESPQIQSSTPPRGPLPEPVRDDHGPARGDCGRHGGAALHAAPPRQRRAHEVHGCAAAPRVAGDGDRARSDRADRGRLRARRSAFLAQELLTRLLGDLVRADLPPPTLAPAWLGAATALAILVGFALPPMLQLKRVPPGARAAQEPRAAAAALLPCRTASRSRRSSASCSGWCATPGSSASSRPGIGGHARGALRRGLLCWCALPGACAARSVSPGATASRTSRGAGARASCRWSAFGLGLMVLLLLAVVRGDLLETWRASLPADTPNYFMINIPDAETRDFAGSSRTAGCQRRGSSR